MNSSTFESTFGPASEMIDISKFLEATETLVSATIDELHPDIAKECSVHDVKSQLEEIWSNPTLSAQLLKEHEQNVNIYYAPAYPRSSKSNRKGTVLPESAPTEFVELRKHLDASSLTAHKLLPETSFFIRPPRIADSNVLQEPERHSTCSVLGHHEALLTCSIYARVAWAPTSVTRISQHSILTSQSLQDLYDVIKCPFGGLRSSTEPERFAICIEGSIYGDGQSNPDYSQKLLELLKSTSKSSLEVKTRAKETKFTDLALRLHEPYWLLHHGNCEHFLCFERIRLFHPTDVKKGYPLTLQRTPCLLDLCRACLKVPAALAVTGDVRLGESPCVLCQPCWKWMGESEDEEVRVTRLL